MWYVTTLTIFDYSFVLLLITIIMSQSKEKSVKHTIKGIHAVNNLEKSRDLRNGQYEQRIVNGKTLMVLCN